MSRFATAAILATTLLAVSANAQTAQTAQTAHTEAMGWTYVSPIKHDSPWRICRDFVAGNTSRSCRVNKMPFASQGEFQSLWELRKFDGEARYSTLAVAGPQGVTEAHFSYNVDDPTFPGCPSIVLPLAFERAWVEDGHLVLITVGDVATYVDPNPNIPLDIGLRSQLVRNVLVLSWVDQGLQTKDYTTAMSPTFGFKVNRHHSNKVAWSSLPWQKRTRPTVIDGRLIDPPT